MALPPTRFARDMYYLFKVPDGRGKFNHSSRWIKSTCALHTARECRIGINELLTRKVIVETNPQHYELNQKRGSQSEKLYLDQLEVK